MTAFHIASKLAHKGYFTYAARLLKIIGSLPSEDYRQTLFRDLTLLTKYLGRTKKFTESMMVAHDKDPNLKKFNAAIIAMMENANKFYEESTNTPYSEFYKNLDRSLGRLDHYIERLEHFAELAHKDIVAIEEEKIGDKMHEREQEGWGDIPKKTFYNKMAWTLDDFLSNVKRTIGYLKTSLKNFPAQVSQKKASTIKLSAQEITPSTFDSTEIPTNDFGKAVINAKKLFGITSFEIDKDEIKEKYIKLMKKWHPDKNQGNKEAEEMSRKISKAYSILLNLVDDED